MEIEAKSIHHLGIVSGICDEIELEKTINSVIKQNKNTKISIGTRIKAMVINGLGFTGRPLYLSEQFYEKKALELIFDKESILAEDLNDDALGRALDAIYEAGPEYIFSIVAAQAVKHYNVETKKLHFDTTSYSVEGEYENGFGLMKFGYSKDLRKDLKQMILSSFVTNDGAIPLMMQALPGNTSDAKYFKEALRTLKNNALSSQDDFVVVFDAAGYNKETIAGLDGITWITRVPDTINEARELKNRVSDNAFVELENGYSIFETTSEYASVKQRWFIINSKKALAREKKTIAKLVKNEERDLLPKIKKLCSKKFSCKEDAEKTFNDFANKTKYHKMHLEGLIEEKKFTTRGKPTANTPFKIVYRISAKAIADSDKINRTIGLKGKFIIATNGLNPEKLSAEEALKTYKEQSMVEGGFRFLKNPICMAKSVYLKSEKRIVALAVVMFICLLVYAIAERALRIALKQNNETVLSQLKKPMQNPTMRWIFQKMEDIIVVTYKQSHQIITEVKNLTDELVKIISFLGKSCMAKYRIPLKEST